MCDNKDKVMLTREAAHLSLVSRFLLGVSHVGM